MGGKTYSHKSQVPADHHTTGRQSGRRGDRKQELRFGSILVICEVAKI